MPIPPQQTVYYKRARFTSRLPKGYLYTPSHFWLREAGNGRWEIGLTRFALRMLGDLVEHEFSVAHAGSVEPGDKIGWIEGFKAVSDIYCAAAGEFDEANPALERDLTLVDRDHYDEGWLYSVVGKPDERSMDVDGYVDLLDRAIDRVLMQQQEQKAREC